MSLAGSNAAVNAGVLPGNGQNLPTTLQARLGGNGLDLHFTSDSGSPVAPSARINIADAQSQTVPALQANLNATVAMAQQPPPATIPAPVPVVAPPQPGMADPAEQAGGAAQRM